MKHHYKYIKGFTLAEVLITLGIIGIVAALIIPAFIYKYRMKVFATQFKKQYSVLQNTINYIVAEEAVSQCYLYYPAGNMSYQSKKQDCEALKSSLVSQLKLIPANVDYSKFHYTKKADVLANGGRTLNPACTIDDFTGQNKVLDDYITSDGAFLRLSLNEKYAYFPIIILDVNGFKGPNKWGYDVFFMTLTQKDRDGSVDPKIYLTDEYCSLVEKGGLLPRTILQNKEKTEDSDFSIFWN